MRARALLLGLAAAGCASTRSLETGIAVPARQIRADARSTWEILAGAPAWIARDVERDAAALRSTFARAGEDVASDGRETLGHLTGLPDFLARETARDLPQLRWSFSEAIRGVGEDAARTGSMARGAPGWLAREFEEGSAGLGWLLRGEAEKARRDAREFPGALARFFRMGLW